MEQSRIPAVKTGEDVYRLTIPAGLWSRDGFVIRNTVRVSHTARGALVLEGPAEDVAEGYANLTGLEAPPMECVLPIGGSIDRLPIGKRAEPPPIPWAWACVMLWGVLATLVVSRLVFGWG